MAHHPASILVGMVSTNAGMSGHLARNYKHIPYKGRLMTAWLFIHTPLSYLYRSQSLAKRKSSWKFEYITLYAADSELELSIFLLKMSSWSQVSGISSCCCARVELTLISTPAIVRLHPVRAHFPICLYMTGTMGYPKNHRSI